MNAAALRALLGSKEPIAGILLSDKMRASKKAYIASSISSAFLLGTDVKSELMKLIEQSEMGELIQEVVDEQFPQYTDTVRKIMVLK